MWKNIALMLMNLGRVWSALFIKNADSQKKADQIAAATEATIAVLPESLPKQTEK